MEYDPESIETIIRRTILDVLQPYLSPRRKALSADTKTQHRDLVLLAYKGFCPCCHRNQVINEDGSLLPSASFDHFSGNRSDSRPHQTWLICTNCNGRLYREPGFREDCDLHFRSYQNLRRQAIMQPELEYDSCYRL